MVGGDVVARIGPLGGRTDRKYADGEEQKDTFHDVFSVNLQGPAPVHDSFNLLMAGRSGQAKKDGMHGILYMPGGQ